MSEKSNCLFVGLPGSGKSTFIAALWHLLETKELETNLEINTLPADRTYLNKLRNSWLICKPVERNKFGHNNNIVLNIEQKTSGRNADFIFPDVSGEMFEVQFERRKISEDYATTLQSTSGAILFINPEHLKRPVLIGDLKFDEEDDGEVLNSDISNLPPQWKHKDDAPTQVILIDLIQMIMSFIPPPLKLAVVISAWDLIKNAVDLEYRQKSPPEWIKLELPLLHQYLKSNDKIEHTIFGISAQGGKYDGDISSLHNMNKQSERIKVEYEGSTTNDISQPINWIFNA